MSFHKITQTSKNFLFMIAIGLVGLVGCSKEEISTTNTATGTDTNTNSTTTTSTIFTAMDNTDKCQVVENQRFNLKYANLPIFITLKKRITNA